MNANIENMKMVTLLFLLVSVTLSGQTQMGDLQEKHYSFCHKDLDVIERLEAYPNFPTQDLCSIQSCFRSIGYEAINEVIYKRLLEIAAINFNKGILLYLIDGPKSIEHANIENVNLNDDKGFIYISIDEFLNAREIIIAKDIYNTQTKRLLKNKI